MKALFVFGTRPEAIKLAPLIREMRQRPGVAIEVCSTAQHREMADQVIRFFDIPLDYDLNLMRPNQSLFDLTARLFSALEGVVRDARPDVVIVQGDTTTAFVGAMAGFYAQKQIAHVEAGLRSHEKYAPFPEEVNRRLLSHLADFHFAPTPLAKRNLEAEGIREGVWVVGNTVIDALLWASELVEREPSRWLRAQLRRLDLSGRILLATAHRRESFGAPLEEICDALLEVVSSFPDVKIVFPVHPNPRVREVVEAKLGGVPRVLLLPPLSYPEFVWMMKKAYFVLTDSGGVQEEAPSLGKPVLVLREVTERTEGVAAGVARLVGTRRERIAAEAATLLNDAQAYQRMAHAENPYGQGGSCAKIVYLLEQAL